MFGPQESMREPEYEYSGSPAAARRGMRSRCFRRGSRTPTSSPVFPPSTRRSTGKTATAPWSEYRAAEAPGYITSVHAAAGATSAYTHRLRCYGRSFLVQVPVPSYALCPQAYAERWVVHAVAVSNPVAGSAPRSAARKRVQHKRSTVRSRESTSARYDRFRRCDTRSRASASATKRNLATTRC